MFDQDIVLPELTAALVTPEAVARYGQLASGSLSRTDFSNDDTLQQLQQMTREKVVGKSVGDRQLADCCLSGLWLLHGFLDASHDISQSIKTREGSFWHGIMHRFEADFGNSKYWYRNVGNHPVIESLQADRLQYYPLEFVDDCESAVEQNDQQAAKRASEMAAQEWQALFGYCLTGATV